MNEIITFLSENWYVIVVVLILLFGIYYTITNKEKIKEWLKWAVTTVEKELGTKTGQIKLRKVYDMFIERFPVFSKLVPFSTFSIWVDEALIFLRNQLENNEAIKAFVEQI
jgi:type II secretory pathway component PulF